jgi:hypothetical protein
MRARPLAESHVISSEWWTCVWVCDTACSVILTATVAHAATMPLFGKKHDSDKKHAKDGDVRKRYEFKDTLGT